MARVIGYARRSAHESDAAPCELELNRAGAVRVFIDVEERGSEGSRPQWAACLDDLRSGDTLLVFRLDQLGSAERTIIDSLHDLGRRGVNIRSLDEPEIDTSSHDGRVAFSIIAALAHIPDQSRRIDTMRGLAVARANGRAGGRPSVMTASRLAEARRMRVAGRSIAQIASVLGVGASSVSRSLARTAQESGSPALPERRVFFRDIKPYDLPISLDQLQGPAHGVVKLPHSVYWGPDSNADLDSPAGIRKVYQSALAEGTAEDQARLLNRDVLRREWQELALPDRLRLAWELRFPELRAAVST